MDIGIASQLTIADLQAALVAILPGCDVAVVESHKALLGVTGDVIAVRVTSRSEFPTGISVNARLAPGCDFEDWLRELARCLSEKLQARTICDGSPFGDSAAPYWSIVWESGQAFLADDCGTAFGDGEGGPVRIVRPLPSDLFSKRIDLARAVRAA